MKDTCFQILIKKNHFMEWLAKEFSNTSAYMTTEEIAEFVFGSIEEAVNNYKEKYEIEDD